MSRASPDYQMLSISERIQLVEDIWDSIANESPDVLTLSASQRAEVARRAELHDAGEATPIEWTSVRDELFQRNA